MESKRKSGKTGISSAGYEKQKQTQEITTITIKPKERTTMEIFFAVLHPTIFCISSMNGKPGSKSLSIE